MSKRICLFCLLLLVFQSATFATTPPRESWLTGVEAEEPHVLAHGWKGTWTDADGYLFSARATFEVSEENKITGEIRWTLFKSPRHGEQAKLGRTGTEYVRGEFDPNTRIITFAGYKKADPHGVIGLDRYKLLLADNDRVIGGITWDHGSWRGLCSFTRN